MTSLKLVLRLITYLSDIGCLEIQGQSKTILALSESIPIDIHKDPVALNKYICEYLTTKGVFENEETDLGTVDVLQSSETQTDAVETEVSDIPKNETAGKLNHL